MNKDWRQPGKLPWGWWLRANGNVLEDENGRTWRSVRDAFWQGELGFSDIHLATEQHELLLRTLLAIGRRWPDGIGRKHDVFGGNFLFWRFYQCWLDSFGMLDRSNGNVGQVSPLDARLSAEGLSVLMMLQATRDPEWEGLPMADIVDAVAASDRGSAHDDRERALRIFEQAIGLRRHVFARERVGISHLVTLTGMQAGGGARMPVRRVTWSMAFTDAVARDDMFAWLATRVDRWDDWGELAYSKGADRLTRHFLDLIVATHSLGSPS
ncbi:hypothetical protein ACFSGX_01635 [Sphingomonas arantia]|uniref:Uncharacterized protein n=1 Tax=Sphingomonas arantia TaxID=1460676 RepID=A0ABW4TUU3_9SPHN